MKRKNFVNPVLLLLCLILQFEFGLQAFPSPNLYWNFDVNCTTGNICFESTIPQSVERYQLERSGIIQKDPVAQGVTGTAVRLSEADVKAGPIESANQCITFITGKCDGFTVSFWIKFHTNDGGRIFRTSATSGADHKPTTTGISFSLRNDRTFKYFVQANGVIFDKTVNTTYKLEEWIHLALIYRYPDEMEVYVNGTKQNGPDDKHDRSDPSTYNFLTLGHYTVDVTMDDLKIWFNGYYPDNITEIFESYTPVEPTTPEATTTQSTITTTERTTTTKKTSKSNGQVTKPQYAEVEIEVLQEVSQNIYKTQQDNENTQFETSEEIVQSANNTVHVTEQLDEILTTEDVSLDEDLAISYLVGVNSISNAVTSPENVEVWQSVEPEEEKVQILNEIIEANDDASESLIDSMMPDNVTKTKIVNTESFALAIVPIHSNESVSIFPSENVKVEIPGTSVAELSSQEQVVLAANIHTGANECYDTIPSSEVIIITRSVPNEPQIDFMPSLPLLVVTEIVSINIRPELRGRKVVLNFKHTMELSEINGTFNLYCAYINKTVNKWTNEHCTILSSNNTHTSVETLHLTNFAILMQVVDVEISETDRKNLSLITYIGSAISISCLVLALCVFALVNNIRGHRTERYHIHANLALAMLLGQVTFLVGARNKPGTDACKATAILLHFFYLSAFSWMLVEGLHLYNLVVKVFRSSNSRLGYYYMIGWGAPLLICVISVAAAYGGYGENKTCWLDIGNSGVIWAFVGPALAVITVNIFILIKVTRIITNLAKSKDNFRECLTDKATIVVCAKAVAVLLPILGVTWIFGVFAVNEETVVFQYFFAICNSLQGFFLFLFHCVFNSETRASLRYRTKSIRSDISSRSVTNSRGKKQTKVELVKHDDVVSDERGGVETMSTAFNANNNRTRTTPCGTPRSSRESSIIGHVTPKAKSKGFKRLRREHGRNERPPSANSGRLSASSRKTAPRVGVAW